MLLLQYFVNTLTCFFLQSSFGPKTRGQLVKALIWGRSHIRFRSYLVKSIRSRSYLTEFFFFSLKTRFKSILLLILFIFLTKPWSIDYLLFFLNIIRANKVTVYTWTGMTATEWILPGMTATECEVYIKIDARLKHTRWLIPDNVFWGSWWS